MLFPLLGRIKRVCETELGIVSQCCNPKAAGNPKRLQQYLENVALKINVKVWLREFFFMHPFGCLFLIFEPRANTFRLVVETLY